MFLATSKHGPHICFVADVLGTDLMNLRLSQPDEAFPVSVVKRIVKQHFSLSIIFIATVALFIPVRGDDLHFRVFSTDTIHYIRRQTR